MDEPRAELGRALAVNALTKPVNVLVPAAVLAAAALLGAAWLAAVALVCWLALATVTFFDEREAQRLGEQRRARRPRVAADSASLAPEIRARVTAAREAREAIRASGWPDLDEEVDELVEALETHAMSAQRIHAFLAERPLRELERRIARHTGAPDALRAQLNALERLHDRLDDLLSEMDNVVAALETMHAELLAADVVEQGASARRLAELRTNVQLRSAGMEEAFAETRDLSRRGG